MSKTAALSGGEQRELGSPRPPAAALTSGPPGTADASAWRSSSSITHPCSPRV
jgi:hypothetical protein